MDEKISGGESPSYTGAVGLQFQTWLNYHLSIHPEAIVDHCSINRSNFQWHLAFWE